MNKQKIIVNVLSNWTNFIVLIGIAFIVSPIMVHNLGNETYGIWTLIISITGYFTVLDFGINTAIVRFISMHVARKDTHKANEIYCTSFISFFIVSFACIIITIVIGAFFKKLFQIESLSSSYLFLIFIVVGTDFALGLLFSVLLGTLVALQEFPKINIISITISVAKSVMIVILLLSGYKILAIAIVQICASVLRYLMQYIIIRQNYGFLHFQLKSCKRSTFKNIYNYSIYSFIIAISLKLLFYTDSIVIGSLISVSMVVFFAIPSMLLDHLQKFIWAMIGVLIPVISSNEALDEIETNRKLYIIGTNYSLALFLPIMFVLFTVGDDFITLWMGREYGLRAAPVLKILLIGYSFFFSQLIAHAILKGISRHKILSYLLAFEAFANLAISISLAKPYGIEGVAIGTALPMLIVNIIAIPIYTCRELMIKFGHYYWKSYSKHVLCVTFLSLIYYILPVRASNYYQLSIYCLSVALFYFIFSVSFILEKDHRNWFLESIKRMSN